MSDEMVGLLTQIAKDVGEMKGSLSAHVKAFDQHVEDDRKAYAAIIQIKTERARQKGFMAALYGVGIAVSTAIGWILDWKFGGGHSH